MNCLHPTVQWNTDLSPILLYAPPLSSPVATSTNLYFAFKLTLLGILMEEMT